MPSRRQQIYPAESLLKSGEVNVRLAAHTAANNRVDIPFIVITTIADGAPQSAPPIVHASTIAEGAPQPAPPTVHASMQSSSQQTALISMQNQIAILQRQLKEAEVRLSKSDLGKNKELLARSTNALSFGQTTPVVSDTMSTMPISMSRESHTGSCLYPMSQNSNMLPSVSQHPMYPASQTSNIMPNAFQHSMYPTSQAHASALTQQSDASNIFLSSLQPTINTAASQANLGGHIQIRDNNITSYALQQSVLSPPVYMHPATFALNSNNRAPSYTNSPARNSVDSAIQLQRAATNDINGIGSMTSRKQLIDLPEFSGQPEEWPIFYTAYVESTVAYGYTKFENNQRLYKCLKGEAREVVKSLLIHPNNVNDAVEHLRTRFGRPEVLIRSQLKQIREVSPISENSIGKIVQFETTKNLSIFLQSINGEHHIANPTLLEELVRKLPMSKRVEWARHRQIFHVSEVQGNATNAIKCSICKGGHKIYVCKQFLDANVTDRWTMVKRHKLCFSCLNYGHSTRDCHRRKTCVINNCGKKYNKLLHENPNAKQRSVGSPTTNPSNQSSKSTNGAVLSCNTNINSSNKLLFRVVPVTLHGPTKSVDVFALLDEGSSVTMVDRDLLEELGVSGQRKRLDIQWFGGRAIQEPTVLVDLYINGRRMKKKHMLRNVYGVNSLNLPTQTLSGKDLENFKFGKQFTPSLYSNATPKMLIGLDHCHLGLPSEIMGSEGNGPYAAHTELGWVIFGQTNRAHKPSATCLLTRLQNDSDVHDIVSDYFKTENFGVKTVPPVLSDDDKRANAMLEANTIEINGRFQVGLLWKSDDGVLPESYSMALKRLVGIERKMKRNEEFAKAYSEIIDSYVHKGYARKVNADQMASYRPRTWYLPHFAASMQQLVRMGLHSIHIC